MNLRKSLGDFLLLSLEKSVDGYIRLEDFAYNSHIYAAGYDRPLKRSALSQTLKRLREKGLVEFIDEGELALRLTDLGKDKALWVKFSEQQKDWDHKWRIVIWDIPEKRKAARNLLRQKIKQLGFTKWQRSVWASKVDCTDILRDYIRKAGIKDWVTVIESDNVGKSH